MKDLTVKEWELFDDVLIRAFAERCISLGCLLPQKQIEQHFRKAIKI